jgi:hypothetical protein
MLNHSSMMKFYCSIIVSVPALPRIFSLAGTPNLAMERMTVGLGTVHSPQSILAKANVIGQFTRAISIRISNISHNCPTPTICTATHRMVCR